MIKATVWFRDGGVTEAQFADEEEAFRWVIRVMRNVEDQYLVQSMVSGIVYYES